MECCDRWNGELYIAIQPRGFGRYFENESKFAHFLRVLKSTKCKIHFFVITDVTWNDGYLQRFFQSICESLSVVAFDHCTHAEGYPQDFGQLVVSLLPTMGVRLLDLQLPLCSEAGFWEAFDQNYEIQSMRCQGIHGSDNYRKIQHVCDLNRAHRKILKNTEVTTSVWPVLLQRVQEIQYSMNPEHNNCSRSNIIFWYLRYGLQDVLFGKY